ncbi:hypothetical protein [Parapedomonas caeni]
MALSTFSTAERFSSVAPVLSRALSRGAGSTVVSVLLAGLVEAGG